jgi:hypothetical protein
MAAPPLAVTDAEVIRLPRRARAWRVVLLLVVGALFAAGTAIGDDHWWPFGPWRMFSTSTPPSGAVVALSLEVQTGPNAAWTPAGLSLSSVGLNRAEVEGRIPEMTAHPEILATLARTHARLRPSDRPWTGVRVVRNETLLKDGAPTGERRSRVLAEWIGP